MSALALPALVLWCDPDKLCVECPYCGAPHVHATTRTRWKCKKFNEDEDYYQPILPVDEYEIDKEKARFVWSGFDEHSQQLVMDTLISKCLDGDFAFVLKYLAKSKPGSSWACSSLAQRQRRLFIEGTDVNGNTVLARVSGRKNSPAMIALLIDNGSNVNARNSYGRTPLMAAAKQGRMKNTLELLRRGADVQLKDYKGRTAKDLAVLSNSSRIKTISALEQALSSSISAEGTMYFFRRDSSALVDLYKNTSGANITATFGLAQDSTKTIARLDRGGVFAPVDAWSGWVDYSNFPTATTISREVWTEKVFDIARLVNHNLQEDDRDQGRPGRFNACHAEKQLIAYFVTKHVFERAHSRLVTLRKSRMGQLLCSSSRACLSRATIIVSKPICPDCEDFCELVNAKWSLSIIVQFRPPPSTTNDDSDDEVSEGSENNGSQGSDHSDSSENNHWVSNGEDNTLEDSMQALGI